MTSHVLRRVLPVLALLQLLSFAYAADTPACTISANFNGTPIAGGTFIWFNSIFSLPGFDPSHLTSKLTISFTGVTIKFSTFTVTAPDASITYDPAATKATTTFIPGTPGQWNTTLPTSHLAGDNFLDAAEFSVPATGLPGAIQPVTWTGTFTSSRPLSVQWKWAAAVYTRFSTDYNSLDVKPVDDNQASSYQTSDHAGTPENFKAYVIGGARGGGGSNYTGSYSGTSSCTGGPSVTDGAPVPQGSCLGSSSLSALVVGKNVTAYVPKGRWSSPTSDVSVVNVEGSSITPTRIPTAPDAINSCASNPITGQTVCSANNNDVYILKGTALDPSVSPNPLASAGSGTIEFSGGACTNCGVMMDSIHNKAAIALSVSGAPGFQFLDLGPSPTFEPPFTSPSGLISEDPLLDPISNLLLSASEANNYEIVNLATSTSLVFFENPIPGPGEADSSSEDCSTRIALAPYEDSSPSAVYLADLKQATFAPGSPAGSWTVPATAEQVQTLTNSFLSSGANGSSVAQGTHTGVITGEFGGNVLTAIALPTTSGSGTPTITNWMSCAVSPTFDNSLDPHAITAYKSPNTGDAIALLSGNNQSILAVVDLTLMLSLAETTPGSHLCASGILPSTVVGFVTVP